MKYYKVTGLKRTYYTRDLNRAYEVYRGNPKQCSIWHVARTDRLIATKLESNPHGSNTPALDTIANRELRECGRIYQLKIRGKTEV